MRKVSSKNVLMKDGSVRRRPFVECEKLLASGQAKRFISNTVYKALKLGLEVKNLNTRDENGKLKASIRDVRDKATKRSAKKAAKAAKSDQTEESEN